MTIPIRLQWHDDTYAVARVAADQPCPAWANFETAGVVSITRTAIEWSIVMRDNAVPTDVQSERGFVLAEVEGPLDFALTGILARLTGALAEADVSVFAFSTYDTD